jgi:hypothetical protein
LWKYVTFQKQKNRSNFEKVVMSIDLSHNLHMLGINEIFSVPSKSVAGVPSSCCNSGPASAWHESNYVANSPLWNGRPLCLQRYEQLIGCCWGIGSCSQASLQLVPYVLNWFKSRERENQGRVLMLLAVKKAVVNRAVWGLALSCWNTALGVTIRQDV